MGEGGLNAFYASSKGVPVILASGDLIFTQQFEKLLDTRTVSTKKSISPQVAELIHPAEVNRLLQAATRAALGDLRNAKVLVVTSPIDLRIQFATTTRPDILEAIPHMQRVDGYTVRYEAADMEEAYRLIRLMYKYISW